MIIRINKLTKLYGPQKAINEISFELKQGELVGFLGPNGAGKSTTMKIITGFLAASSGEVLIDDELMTPSNHQLRRSIGYLPENNPIYTDLYVKEYLSYTAGMYGLKQTKKEVERVISMTGLTKERTKKIGALSKGYRQRVGLAQALIHNPKLLILDEPTTGLDPNQLEEIRTLITNISEEKTVLLSTHIMQEVEAICNRVLIINEGKIIADSPTAAMKSNFLFTGQRVFVEFMEDVNIEKIRAELQPKNIEPINNRSIIVTGNSDQDIRPKLFNYAVEQKLTLLSLKEEQAGLEHIFQKLTKK